MQDQKKLEGLVVYWNRIKRFGFIEQRIPALGGGYQLQRFYFSQSRIDFIIPDEPSLGCHARFNINPRPRKFPTDSLFAENVEIFETSDQMKVFVTATEAK
jgi:hypothetical protein